MRESKKPITVPAVLESKLQGKKLTAVTAYDYTLARLIDQTDIDVVLVGDSVASIVQGEPNTIPVTVDEMIYHSRCVEKGLTKALLVCDMPFMSYQVSKVAALENAGRIIKEGKATAVKLEGGRHISEIVKALTEIDIPVMGHLGLTPQSYHRMGGHRVQGKSGMSGSASPDSLIEDALILEESGAFAIVLEAIPAELAAEITEKLHIPTIGIGAGASCDGQILVLHDLLGLSDGKKPRFVRKYADLATQVTQALDSYVGDVISERFPSVDESYQDNQKPVIKAVS